MIPVVYNISSEEYMKKLMKKVSYFALLPILAVIAFPLVVLAQETAPDLGDSVVGLIDAIRVGGFSVIVAAAVQLLKTDFLGGFVNKVHPRLLPFVVTLATIGLSVATAMATGRDLMSAAIEALFISGGAIALYEHGKALFGKKA
jgi:hypothetical protein